TASPRRRDAMIPSLSQSRELGSARTVMYFAAARRPCFWTSVNSLRARRRTSGPSRCDMQWPPPRGVAQKAWRPRSGGRRHRESLAALGAATLQNEAAILRRHPDEEAVSPPAV